MKRAGEGLIRAGYGSSTKNKDFSYHLSLILSLIFKYKSIIKMNLDLMEFISINFDEYSDILNHWIALHALNNVNYFDSFGGEDIPKEIKIIIDKSIVVVNNFRT